MDNKKINPFPKYTKKLKNFNEITPEIAKQVFKWLCKKEIKKEELNFDNNG